MQELIEIIENPQFQQIVLDYQSVQKIKEEMAYNIFNLSIYNNQLENFHSDIIASLLDPNGLHGE